MAIVAGGNRDRSVARPPWVRRHDSQHEGIVAGIMLALVIVAIGIFLFSSQLIRLVGPISAMLHPASPASLRPGEGAQPSGPLVVVSLDSPTFARNAPAPGDAPAADDVDQASDASAAMASDGVAASALIDHPLPGDQLAAMAPAIVNPEPEVQAAPAAEPAADAQPTAETQPTAEARPTAQPTAVPTATPARVATPAPTSVARGGSAVAGRRARVVRTDGRGVILYSAPRDGARTPAGVPEGGVVTVLSVQGAWAQVQADARRTGWIPVQFLASE